MRIPLLSVILFSQIVFATNVFPQEYKLVFSGNSGKDEVFDLAEYNRISFGTDKMIISNRDDLSNRIILPYSSYNRFRVEEYFFSEITPVITYENSLSYSTATKELYLNTAPDAVFGISIFSLDGMLALHQEMKGGGSLSVGGLRGGTYIAVASGDQGNYIMKFIK